MGGMNEKAVQRITVAFFGIVFLVAVYLWLSILEAQPAENGLQVLASPQASATATAPPDPGCDVVVRHGENIQNALNDAGNGAVVCLRGGSYDQRVELRRRGQTLQSYPGEWAVLDSRQRALIEIRADDISVLNLGVRNATDDDIHIDGVSNARLDGLEVLVTGRGVKIENSRNVTVRNCTISTPAYVARQTDGIYSQRNQQNIYENNSIIIYNTHTGGHDDAIQMYLDRDMIVRGNYLAQVNSKTSNAQGLYATTMHGYSYFYNNVIDLGNARSNALSFRRLGGSGTVEIAHNTVIARNAYHGIWVTETDGHKVHNNISWVEYGAAYTISSGGQVSHNYTGNPGLTGDNRLQAGSPAIDRGAALASPYLMDKDGLPRPQGGGWDMGAYEYSSGTLPASLTPTRTPNSTVVPPTNTGTMPPTSTRTMPPTSTGTVPPTSTGTVTLAPPTATPSETPTSEPTTPPLPLCEWQLAYETESFVHYRVTCFRGNTAQDE